MHKKLEEILNKTRQDLLRLKKPTSAFAKAVKKESLAIIAEVKLASPSEGNLGDREDMVSRVKNYVAAGADAISVVTEKYFFKGDPKFVEKIKKVTSLPILQKDFILDPYQLYEAKKMGADAVLLIARILSKTKLADLVDEARRIGLEAVVEIQRREDLTKALSTKTKIIAVNARDLDTFEVDVDKACELLTQVPKKYIKLGFSGVLGKDEACKYQKAGANGILIGTSLMKTNKIFEFLDEIRKVQVKICGIRTKKAAKAAINAGADFLGFNFVKISNRYIDPKEVKKILDGIVRSNIKTVGVFRDSSANEVNEIAKYLELDIVQIHGEVDPDYCREIKSALVIKAFNISADFNVEEVEKQMRGYDVDYYLVDREVQGQGELLNPDKVKQLSHKFPILLSGGLNPENVAVMVQRAKPKAVDISSGVETDGQKDPEKIRAFIKRAKEAI